MALLASQKTPAKPSGRQFVEYLVAKNFIKPGFRSVLRDRDLQQIDQYLLSKNIVARDQLPKLYADYYGLPFIDLSQIEIKKEIINLIPQEIARKYQVVAYDLRGKDLAIAIGRPSMLQQSAPNALLGLRQQKGLDIHLAVTPAEQVSATIDRMYGTPVAERTIPSTQPNIAAPTESPSSAVKSLNKHDLIEEVDPREKTVNLTTLKIPHEVLRRIPYNVAKKYQVVVFGTNMQRGQYEPPLIQIGAVDHNDIHTKEILAYIEQKNKVLIDRYMITPESLQSALSQYSEEDRKSLAPAPPFLVPGKAAEPPAQPKPVVPNVAAAPVLPIPETRTPLEGLVLSEADIIVKPSDQPVGDDGNGKNPFEDQDLEKLLEKPVDTPEALAAVVKKGAIPEIISAILFFAIRMKASDVHIEAQKKIVRFRYRVDGILHDIISAPQFLHAPLISRIKILSKMKIDEQRVPQDGRFDVTIGNRQVDLRVSTLPTVFGEKIVMRLLDKSAAILTLEQLGVTESNFDTLVENINKPYGIILSTGPTGSGKTTTLYAILNRISKPGINIITLEDPVEYELPGINQSQVKPQIGFTFADGLRSVLRQDPNVIMVGEIRDLETAAMATHAALTGHLVLSTLHTNDASGALPRLINMGVEPFLITSSINAVVGQRLVRRICDECREKTDIPPAIKSYIKKELAEVPSGQLKDINLEQLIFYKGRGCKNCSNGYRGRIGIFEVLPMDDEIEDLAVRKEPSNEVKRAAIKNGMVTMVQDGLIKALKGITTVDEVMRVTTASIKDAPQEE